MFFVVRRKRRRDGRVDVKGKIEKAGKDSDSWRTYSGVVDKINICYYFSMGIEI